MIVNFLYVPNLSLLNGAIPANLEALFEHVGRSTSVRVREAALGRREAVGAIHRKQVASKLFESDTACRPLTTTDNGESKWRLEQNDVNATIRTLLELNTVGGNQSSNGNSDDRALTSVIGKRRNVLKLQSALEEFGQTSSGFRVGPTRAAGDRDILFGVEDGRLCGETHDKICW